MTHVISLAGRRARIRVHTSASPPAPITTPAGHTLACGAGAVERQAAIENALSMALYFMRQPGNTAANLWAATARTNRALTLLKQAGESTANLTGRVSA